MTPTPHSGSGLSERDLAARRVDFLTAELDERSRVRNTILASWRRSRDLKVAADQIELPYVRDADFDTPLTRSAEPVLRSLREQLDGQPVSVILTDPAGLVLSRLTADADLERHLDKVLLAPGFSYAEQFVGTNGIGTALEIGGPAHVFGHEHYAENLEDLACAGVPIHHPVTGRTVGAVDLTCWRRHAGSLLLTLAKTTAERIRQALLAETGVHQLEVFTEYLRTCHRVNGIVFAVNGDTVMLNDIARSTLEPGDQAALVGQAAEALTGVHRGSTAVWLPSGATARMYWRPVHAGDHLVGAVVHVKLEDPRPAPSGDPEIPNRMALPGLVGSAPLWLRACNEVERGFRSGQWLAVQGEAGVGKLSLLRAVQLRRQPVGRFTVFDCADAETDPHWTGRLRRTLMESGDSVVIRHVDRLDAPRVRTLSATLSALRQGAPGAPRAQQDRPLWVAVTLRPGADREDLSRLLRLFPTTVEVPPLRMHLEDLHPLVAFFLARLGHGGQLTCSPEAMQLLMRSSWPGNAEQLNQVLRQAVQHRRTGAILPADLPPEVRTVSRRLLSPLESMERDAIVQSLGDAKGNKAEAARSLGVSRATIYRKIHEYGIVAPSS